MNPRKKIALTIYAVLIAVLIVWVLIVPTDTDRQRGALVQECVLYLWGVCAALLALWYCGYTRLLRLPCLRSTANAPLPVMQKSLIVIAAAAVCVNNFPVLGYIWNEVTLTRVDLLWLFVLYCLAVGVFEEVLFRGVLLPLWLERYGKRRHGTFWGVAICCAVFALFHLFRLALGASVGAVLLQVGYSFLIGGMCAVVLLATGSVSLCALLHAVYDFGGLFVPVVAQGRIWNTPTVLWTSGLGICVGIFLLWELWHMPQERIELLQK